MLFFCSFFDERNRDRQHQLKFLSSYCFRHCIKRFDEREVNENDGKCISNCTDKYMNSWDRLLQRYQAYVLPPTKNVQPSNFKLFKKLAKGWWMKKNEQLQSKVSGTFDDALAKQSKCR